MASLISKASLLMVPSVYEDGTLYNVLPSGNKAPDETGNHNGYDQTRADFTFSRGSNLAATRVNASGLIEKGRENLLTYSNTFSDSDWANDDTTETSGFEGYDGTNDAWKLVGNTNASRHHIIQSTSLAASVYTFSVYAKASGHNYVQLASAQSVTQYVNFDLSDGSVGNSGSTFIEAKAEDLGNGWYRLSVVNTTWEAVGFYISLVSSKTAAWLESWTMPNSTDGIFIQDAQLEAGLVATDYIETGATTATAGVLENTPRIDYSSGAGALLLEPQRTNVITQSEYFGAWTATGLTISSNEATSPEGVSNAAKLTLPSGSAIKRIALGSMPVTAVARSYSFFVKSDDISAVQLVHSGDVQGYARFDISSGVVGSKGSKTTSDIEDYGNGWYRCIANFDATNSFGSTIYLYINDSATGGYGGSTNAQGDLFVFGAQYEEASYPSSYVPTYGSAATRGADSCSVTGASDVIGQSEGTIFAEVDWNVNPESGSPVVGIITLNNGANNLQNCILLGIERQSGGTNRVYCFVTNSNVTQAEIYGSAITDGTYKIAFAYKANDFALYVNGSQIGTDTSGSVPALSEVLLGKRFGTDTYIQSDGTKQAVLFNERLSNTELAALTA